MKKCIACGMPMNKASEFADGDETKDYCIHCARPDGSMQSFTEKKAGMIQFLQQTQGIDEAAATPLTEKMMKGLPAWKECF